MSLDIVSRMEPRAPLPASAASEVITADSRAPVSREALGGAAATPISAERSPRPGSPRPASPRTPPPRKPLPDDRSLRRAPLGSPAPRTAAPGSPPPPTAPVTAGKPDPQPPLAVNVPAIVALSEDHTLLQALTVAVIEQAAVVTAPSADRFVDQLVANGAEVALIDAASAPNPIAGFLRGLRGQLPQLRLIVVGRASLQQELRGQLADDAVFRYAHKPASVQRLKLIVSAALRAGRPDAPPGELVPAAGTGPASRADAPPHWLWPLLLSLLALGAMVVGWYASSFASQRHLLP